MGIGGSGGGGEGGAPGGGSGGTPGVGGGGDGLGGGGLKPATGSGGRGGGGASGCGDGDGGKGVGGGGGSCGVSRGTAGPVNGRKGGGGGTAASEIRGLASETVGTSSEPTADSIAADEKSYGGGESAGGEKGGCGGDGGDGGNGGAPGGAGGDGGGATVMAKLSSGTKPARLRPAYRGAVEAMKEKSRSYSDSPRSVVVSIITATPTASASCQPAAGRTAMRYSPSPRCSAVESQLPDVGEKPSSAPTE